MERRATQTLVKHPWELTFVVVGFLGIVARASLFDFESADYTEV